MDLKDLIFASIAPTLADAGFVPKQSKQSFVRSREGTSHIFQLVLLTGQGGLRIQPNVGVRIDKVENIFHETSGFRTAYDRNNTPTIGNSIGAISFGDSAAFEILVNGDQDVPKAKQWLLEAFERYAAPYFEKYSTLKSIDDALNSQAHAPSVHRSMPWLRCSTGIIVAKLVGRADFEQVATIYEDSMRKIDKGFYFSRFAALMNVLKTVKCQAIERKGADLE